MAKLKIHDSGKIDIHRRVAQYRAALSRLNDDTDLIPENKALIISFLSDAELGKTVLKGQKKKLGPGRCLKYLNIFKQLSSWFDKPFNCVNQADMEKFVRDLESGARKPIKKARFSEETKADYKHAVRKLYKWLNGGHQYPALVEWIDTSVKQREIPSLTRAEVEKMIDATGNRMDKTAVMVLFDSGARIEEFLNIRLKHVTKKEDYYQTRIEFSKTKARTISLPLCTELIDKWLPEHPIKDNPEAQLFPYLSYEAFRSMLKRLGIKAIQKPVNPHLMRHSSATFYCNTLNRFQLCYRYGWSMSSDMPDRYIDREGIQEKETAKKIQGAELSVVMEKNQHITEDFRMLKSQHDKLEAQFQQLQERDKLATALLDALSKDKTGLAKLTKILSEKGLIGNIGK